MIPLTPSFLVAAATAFIDLGEDRDRGGNLGQMVRVFLRQVHQPPGHPWSAAFVYHVGYWSHYDQLTGRSTWPLPATGSCRQLGDFARDHKLLEAEPALGDVFLVWDPQVNRFAHSGVIASVAQCLVKDRDRVYDCLTVEGNANYDGTRDGYLTVQRTRRFSPRNGDRFIRWSRAEAQSEAA